MKKKLIGIVLCGGKSTRMGQDKGLLTSPKDGGTWAGKLRELLFKVGAQEVLFSVGKHNQLAYAQNFDANQLVIDRELKQVPTPLIGILSAYQQLQSNNGKGALLVLACDLQLLDEEIIAILLQGYTADAESIHILSDGKFLQPLAGVYPFRCLKQLNLLAASNDGQNRSVRSLVLKTGAKVHELPEFSRHKLKNFNSPSDL